MREIIVNCKGKKRDQIQIQKKGGGGKFNSRYVFGLDSWINVELGKNKLIRTCPQYGSRIYLDHAKQKKYIVTYVRKTALGRPIYFDCIPEDIVNLCVNGGDVVPDFLKVKIHLTSEFKLREIYAAGFDEEKETRKTLGKKIEGYIPGWYYEENKKKFKTLMNQLNETENPSISTEFIDKIVNNNNIENRDEKDINRNVLKFLAGLKSEGLPNNFEHYYKRNCFHFGGYETIAFLRESGIIFDDDSDFKDKVKNLCKNNNILIKDSKLLSLYQYFSYKAKAKAKELKNFSEADVDKIEQNYPKNDRTILNFKSTKHNECKKKECKTCKKNAFLNYINNPLVVTQDINKHFNIPKKLRKHSRVFVYRFLEKSFEGVVTCVTEKNGEKVIIVRILPGTECVKLKYYNTTEEDGFRTEDDVLIFILKNTAYPIKIYSKPGIKNQLKHPLLKFDKKFEKDEYYKVEEYREHLRVGEKVFFREQDEKVQKGEITEISDGKITVEADDGTLKSPLYVFPQQDVMMEIHQNTFSGSWIRNVLRRRGPDIQDNFHKLQSNRSRSPHETSIEFISKGEHKFIAQHEKGELEEKDRSYGFNRKLEEYRSKQNYKALTDALNKCYKDKKKMLLYYHCHNTGKRIDTRYCYCKKIYYEMKCTKTDLGPLQQELERMRNSNRKNAPVCKYCGNPMAHDAFHTILTTDSKETPDENSEETSKNVHDSYVPPTKIKRKKSQFCHQKKELKEKDLKLKKSSLQQQQQKQQQQQREQKQQQQQREQKQQKQREQKQQKQREQKQQKTNITFYTISKDEVEKTWTNLCSMKRKKWLEQKKTNF
jgi:hypothetical protein